MRYNEYMNRRPLAEQMRPQKLDEVIGQSHLLGEASYFCQIVKRVASQSADFVGTAGAATPTLARIIAREVIAEFVELSAVASGKRCRKGGRTRLVA